MQQGFDEWWRFCDVTAAETRVAMRAAFCSCSGEEWQFDFVLEFDQGGLVRLVFLPL